METECRIRCKGVEVRADADSMVLEGYASTFDDPYPVWDFTEVVRQGAFKDSIAKDDIRALWNHDHGVILGRTKSGTLSLSEDGRGLRAVITLPDTQRAKEIHASIRRGDVDQMSFSFGVQEERWTKPKKPGGFPLRELLKLDLYEVSPVTFPANDKTAIVARGSMPPEVRSARLEVMGEQPIAMPDVEIPPKHGQFVHWAQTR